MKIIEHGNLEHIITCGICHCKFEYDIYDVKSEMDWHSSARNQCIYVECPECAQKIYIRSCPTDTPPISTDTPPCIDINKFTC